MTDINGRLTAASQQVLQLSLRESLQLGHNYIGTEHLLLALIRQGDGVAAQVLTDLGLELATVRQAVIRRLSGPTGIAQRLSAVEARLRKLEGGE